MHGYLRWRFFFLFLCNSEHCNRCPAFSIIHCIINCTLHLPLFYMWPICFSTFNVPWLYILFDHVCISIYIYCTMYNLLTVCMYCKIQWCSDQHFTCIHLTFRMHVCIYGSLLTQFPLVFETAWFAEQLTQVQTDSFLLTISLFPICLFCVGSFTV